jgi:hypothetical protein
MAANLKMTRRRVAAIVLVLWAISLALPVASFTNPNYSYVPGAFVALIGLVFGWLEFQIGAFANLILLGLCLVLFVGRRPWVALAWIAEALALWSFTWSNLPDDYSENPIAHFSYGFYFWQIAILLLATYVIFEKTLAKAGYIEAPAPSIPQS